MTPQQILRSWAEKQNKTISDLNEILGYQSNFVFLLLSPTKPRKFTYETLGRIYFFIGDKLAREIKTAMAADGERLNEK